MPKCILTEQHGSSGSPIVPQSIEITTAPIKTNYLAGDTFDPSGMVVEATYAINSIPVGVTEVVQYTVSPTILTDGVTNVTITYSEKGVICTAQQAVTVTHKLTEIAVTTNPVKTSYEYGDTLTTAGMVVTATYSDGQTAVITDYSCSPTILDTVTNSQPITVSYTENGVTKTTTFNVIVNRKSVAKPTWKGDLTYNGSPQSVSDTGYWDNYDTTYMSIGGTTSSTDAGTYIATFTLKDNYRWADGTIDTLDVSWVINKAIGSLTLSTTTVDITMDNYSDGVVITANGDFDGTISITPASVAGLTLNVSGKTITVKGDGSTNVSPTTITVEVSAGTNYTAPASATFTVSAQYWSFGAGNGETADAAWFAGLKDYLASNKGSTLKTTSGSSIVGATKTVTLTTAVLGTTTHLVRVIGVDQDGSNTVTWQTKNCLSQYTTFGNSGYWMQSAARTLCQDYYNYFPGKESIKIVRKGTCTNINKNRLGKVDYNDETVFLLSEREFGIDYFSPISTAHSTTTNAECTYGYNMQYGYYTSNSTRILQLGDMSTSCGYPWERSRTYDNLNKSCYINSDGGANSGSSTSLAGLAPAFVIG